MLVESMLDVKNGVCVCVCLASLRLWEFVATDSLAVQPSLRSCYTAWSDLESPPCSACGVEACEHVCRCIIVSLHLSNVYKCPSISRCTEMLRLKTWQSQFSSDGVKKLHSEG